MAQGQTPTITDFHLLFQCKLSESWYTFAKWAKSPNICPNVPSTLGGWKKRFFFVSDRFVPEDMEFRSALQPYRDNSHVANEWETSPLCCFLTLRRAPAGAIPNHALVGCGMSQDWLHIDKYPCYMYSDTGRAADFIDVLHPNVRKKLVPILVPKGPNRLPISEYFQNNFYLSKESSAYSPQTVVLPFRTAFSQALLQSGYSFTHPRSEEGEGEGEGGDTGSPKVHMPLKDVTGPTILLSPSEEIPKRARTPHCSARARVTPPNDDEVIIESASSSSTDTEPLRIPRRGPAPKVLNMTVSSSSDSKHGGDETEDVSSSQPIPFALPLFDSSRSNELFVPSWRLKEGTENMEKDPFVALDLLWKGYPPKIRHEIADMSDNEIISLYMTSSAAGCSYLPDMMSRLDLASPELARLKKIERKKAPEFADRVIWRDYARDLFKAVKSRDKNYQNLHLAWLSKFQDVNDQLKEERNRTSVLKERLNFARREAQGHLKSVHQFQDRATNAEDALARMTRERDSLLADLEVKRENERWLMQTGLPLISCRLLDSPDLVESIGCLNASYLVVGLHQGLSSGYAAGVAGSSLDQVPGYDLAAVQRLEENQRSFDSLTPAALDEMMKCSSLSSLKNLLS